MAGPVGSRAAARVHRDAHGALHADGGSASNRFPVWLLCIGSVALVLRVLWILAERDSVLRGDGVFYFNLARALAQGKGFIDPHLWVRTGRGVANSNHTPAWPMLLGIPQVFGLRTVFPSQVLGCGVGTSTVVAMGFAGRSIAGDRVGLVAAAIAAVYPSFWVYERELMSETLLLLLMAIAILVAYRFWARPSIGRCVALGGICGLLVLTHPDQLLLIVTFLAPFILLVPTVDRHRRIALLCVAVLAVGTVIAPWVAYNATRFRERVYLTSGLGLTLAFANCRTTYQGERLGSWGVLCGLPVPGGDASEQDSAWRGRAQRFAADRVTQIPVVLAAREGRTWGVFRPLQQTKFDMGIGSPLWVERFRLIAYWALVPFAVLGTLILRRRRIPLIPLIAPVVGVLVTTAMTFGDTRFRAPAEVPIVLLAAVAIGASSMRRGKWVVR